MSYCKRMKRPCICGRFSAHTFSGETEEANSTSCLTNQEVKSALTILLQEWQIRFGRAGNPVCEQRQSVLQ